MLLYQKNIKYLQVFSYLKNTMLVPYYGNKKSLEKTYEDNDYTWIHISKFLSVLDKNIIKDFEDLNWFDVNSFLTKDYLDKCKKYSPVNVNWDDFVEFKDFLFSAKMFFMTWFTCTYGYWKKWQLNKTPSWKFFTHHGIDLVLPKWTPIISFSDGSVKSAEYAKGYWNYIVIKSIVNNETLFLCYEHLESIKVSAWEKVKKWDVIWACWNTWNAYWYHLHFQIDKDTWSFHPYWSSWNDDALKTLKNCIDPWEFLRNIYLWKTIQKKALQNTKVNSDVVWTTKQDKKWNIDQISQKTNNSNANIKQQNINQQKKDNLDIIWTLVKEIDKKNNVKLASYKKEPQEDQNQVKHNSNNKNKTDFIDNISQELSSNSSGGNYIDFFVNAGILKWDKWNYDLNRPLTRYQITLILYRLYKTWLLKINKNKAPCNIDFKDITAKLKTEQEFLKALDFVACNGIIIWDHKNFLPWNQLTWEEFLAIVWRLFAGLKNSSWKRWYETYYNWAVNKKLINSSWLFIGTFITRKEVFKILHTLILS